MFLALPSSKYRDSYLAALEKFRKEGLEEDKSLEEARADFEKFVTRLNEQAEGKNLKEGYVPQTTFWLIDKDEYIGETRIRHYLNENLKNIGGHIGYAIRPSKRRQGYGKKILELALPKAKELGIEQVLLTCDATNIGSKKIIESAGGNLENEVAGENGMKRRYWIELAHV